MRKHSKKIGGVLALCVCSAIANAGYAANSDDLNKYNMDEYVVTATRTELTQKENPRSVEVITKEDIQNSGAISVRDALRNATNLSIQSAGGSSGDTITLRGGDDVLIMVNGKRMASEGQYSFLNQNAHTLDRLNVNNVERIEILRGPEAAIYGSGAQAGIINIITKKSEKPGATIGFTTGTREMSNYYHFDTGKQGKVSAAFDANFSKLRNIDAKADNHLLNGPKQNYTLDVDYEMDDDNKLNLLLDYGKDNLEWYNTSSLMGNQKTGWRNFTYERKSAVLTYDGQNDNSNYSVSASYSKMNRDVAVNDSPNTTGEKEYSTWNIEARDAIKTSENNKLVLGAEYRNDKATIFGSNDQKGIDQYAVYIHDEYNIGDKLLLTPSVRYDHHDSFGGNTSPSIGATYFITDKSRVKASYGSGYRAPSIDELYGIFDHGGMFGKPPMNFLYYGNPNLKPEKTRGYEISYEQEFNDNTSTKLTYFNNKKKDAIEAVAYAGGNNPASDKTWGNIDSASYQGVEFELKHDLGNGFDASFEYDYLDAYNDETNERLDYNARNTYMVKLSWTDPVSKEWNVTAWNKWYSDYRYTAGSMASNPTNGSINTFNIVVNKRWGDKYRAFAGVDNLFNKDLTDMGYYGRLWRCGFEMSF